MFRDNLMSGQVAVITGAARGIGMAVAEALAAAGAQVVITDLSRENLEQARDGLTAKGYSALDYELDVTDPDSVATVFGDIENRAGRVDVLVNNAGTVRRKLLMEHTIDDWRSQFAVNLEGTFLCSKAAVAAMARHGHGAIVNMAAVAAFHYTVEHAAYAATKAGVVAFTRDLAYEVGPQGIRVNAVAPGFIRTPLLAQTLDENRFSHIFRLNRWGEPEDIARAVVFLASEAASFITGVTLPVAGGCDLRVTHER